MLGNLKPWATNNPAILQLYAIVRSIQLLYNRTKLNQFRDLLIKASVGPFRGALSYREWAVSRNESNWNCHVEHLSG